MALYVHIGGGQEYSLQGVTAHSGSVQLGQGAVVPEVAGFLPVEALEMAYGEDLVDLALPQEPQSPHTLDCHPALGV